MSLLFADIFEAIRYLRLCKGTTEKGILSYVQERTGGSLSPEQILKTFRALQKLVEEGVLVKNGKRYTFPTKPKLPEDDDDDEEGEEKDCGEGKKDKEEEEEEEEEEEDDDDDDDDEDDDDEEEDEEEEEEGDAKAEDEEKEEKEEENDDDDDGDDDDEEEEEEDDEDDDGEACDPTEKISTKEDSNAKDPEKMHSEDNVARAISNNRNPLGDGKNNGSSKPNQDKKDGANEENPCTKQSTKRSGIVPNGIGKTDIGKTGFGKTDLGKHGIGKYEREKEMVDRSDTKKNASKKNKRQKLPNEPKSTSDEKTRTVANVIKEIEKLKKRSPSKNRDHTSDGRKSRSRKHRVKNPKHRNASPVKKTKAALFALNLDHSLDIGSFSNSSQMPMETTKTETSLLLENDAEDMRMDYDLFRHRSPAGPPPPNTPGVHLDKKESCCSDIDKYLSEDVKTQSLYEGDVQYSLVQKAESKQSVMSVRDNESRIFRASRDRGRDQKLKRDLPPEGDNLEMTGVAAKSLCSVCKKKRIS